MLPENLDRPTTAIASVRRRTRSGAQAPVLRTTSVFTGSDFDLIPNRTECHAKSAREGDMASVQSTLALHTIMCRLRATANCAGNEKSKLSEFCKYLEAKYLEAKVSTMRKLMKSRARVKGPRWSKMFNTFRSFVRVQTQFCRASSVSVATYTSKLAIPAMALLLTSGALGQSQQPSPPSWQVEPTIILGDYAATGVRGVYLVIVDQTSGQRALFNVGTFYEDSYDQASFVA